MGKVQATYCSDGLDGYPWIHYSQQSFEVITDLPTSTGSKTDDAVSTTSTHGKRHGMRQHDCKLNILARVNHKLMTRC